MVRFGVPGQNSSPLAYADGRLSVVPMVQAPRPPTVNDKKYPMWCEWRVNKNAVAPAEEGDFWKLIRFESNGDATWVKFNEAGTGPLITLSDTANTKVEGDVDGNIRLYSPNDAITGSPSLTILSEPGSNRISFSLPDGPETACSNYIVDPNGTKATYTTVQSAIDQAETDIGSAAVTGAVIFVKPGTYTEDLTISENLTICGFTESTRNAPNQVLLQPTSGNSFTITSNVKFENLSINTNGATLVDIATNAKVICFYNCRLFCEDTYTMLTNTAGGVSSAYQLYNCHYLAGGATAKLFGTANGNVRILSGIYEGATSSANTMASGALIIRDCDFGCGITTSGTAYAQIYRSLLSQTNQTFYTHGSSSAAAIISGCTISTGTATAIAINTGTVGVFNCEINSSNTNVISGAATLNYGGLVFSGSSSNISTTTTNLRSEGPSRIIGSSNVGASNTLTISNGDNTNTGSHAVISLQPGGTSGGDPFINYFIPSGSQYSLGIDNTASDIFKLTSGADPSSGNTLWQVTTAGDADYSTGTGYLGLPNGTSAQQPGSPAEGMIRGNTDNKYPEYYDGAAWVPQVQGQNTWTPVLEFGGGSTGITYTTQSGYYFILGEAIYIWCVIELSSKGTDTGNAVITGLPATATQITPFAWRASNLTFSTDPVFRTNGTTIVLEEATSGAGLTTITDAEFVNTTLIQLSGIYLT